MRAFFDPIQLTHDPKFFLVRGQMRRFLETPARATALLAGCAQADLTVAEPEAADLEAAIAKIHAPDYLTFLADAPAAWAALPDTGPDMVASTHPTPEMRGTARRPASVIGALGWYTADTSCAITAATWQSARAAAACAVAAADEAALGRSAYALCRPPGHHAYAARAGGHCYLNNAAIAVERLRARGADRVAVVDIDAHHGNGTQHIFWDCEDVLTVSIHGDPDGYYPWFVGRADETGPASTNLNLPLPRGSGDAVWLAAIAAGLDRVRAHRSDALVVSVGFDASVDEPLNFLSVTEAGFAAAGAAIADVKRPTAIIQEGGYAVPRLAALLAAFLREFS